MIRDLQVNTAKPVSILMAKENLTRGMAVSYDAATGKVEKATALTGFGFVDVSPNYDGINAAITPTDGDFEPVAKDSYCLFKSYCSGERITKSQPPTLRHAII